MGCLKLSYYEQENALEVNPIFFGNALEKPVHRDFTIYASYEHTPFQTSKPMKQYKKSPHHSQNMN